MNVLIAADMEGIAGIDDYRACLPSHPAAYARGCELMTGEVLAVAEALAESGVERIAVGDWHMVGTNVERGRMPAGVSVRPIAELALGEEAPSFADAAGGKVDAVVMIGHHARTSSPRGFSSHTFVWDMDVLLDGEPLSEVQVYAQGLAAEGIPILAVSGDRWLIDELEPGELGGAALIAAKQGQGRTQAESRPVAQVREDLDAAVSAAVADPPALPVQRAYPAELRITLEGAELAKVTVETAAEVLPAVAAAFRDEQVSRDYRQLAKLLPAKGAALRSAQRRLGAALATPVMLLKERRWVG